MAFDLINPVITSAAFAYKYTNLVALNQDGIQAAASYIQQKILFESYKPQTWREHPLHPAPPTPFDPDHPKTKQVLDFIFLISAINFSFWSDKETPERFAVQWRQSCSSPPEAPGHLWTGYWSLLAAINKALEKGIPITDPFFYSSPSKCPDSVFEELFRPAPISSEGIPLLKERVRILREVGSILCNNYSGSYYNLLLQARREFGLQGLALNVVRKVVNEFPSFRDEVSLEKRRVCFWKRAQILVAETWAAFHPDDRTAPHPIFPEGVTELTMFADYRVPQILYRLRVITYPEALKRRLQKKEPLPYGSKEEISIRSASILAVEEIRKAIQSCPLKCNKGFYRIDINSALIDFWLWDMAKRVEDGKNESYVFLGEELPVHRTRSIWY